MSDDKLEAFESSDEYKQLVARHTDFKEQVYSALTARFDNVLQDQPRGRHNVDFLVKEDFFGYEREWIVVTHSDGRLLPYERAVRVVGSFKEDIERGDVHGVLIVTDRGAEKFAEDFFANNVGFLLRTLDTLQVAKVPSLAFADAGSILSIDQNSQDYEKTMIGLEQTSLTLAGDNRLSLPAALRERLLQELEAMKVLLRSSEIQVNLVVDFIIKTLRTLVDKLAGYTVSTVALATVDAILRLFVLHH